MKQQLYAEYSPEERVQFLENENDGITREKYKRKFKGHEKQKLQKDYFELDRELQDLREELDERKREIKERMKPIEEKKKKIFEDLKAGGVRVEGRLFKMVDRDAREVGMYDEEGVLVDQRAMSMEERQTYLHFEGVSIAKAQ